MCSKDDCDDTDQPVALICDRLEKPLDGFIEHATRVQENKPSFEQAYDAEKNDQPWMRAGRRWNDKQDSDCNWQDGQHFMMAIGEEAFKNIAGFRRVEDGAWSDCNPSRTDQI